MKHRLKREIENGKNTHICNTIRENGGIGNWNIIVMESYTECMNKLQAENRVDTIRTKNNPKNTIQMNSENEFDTTNPQLNKYEEKIKKLEEHIKEQDEKIKKLEQNSIVTTQNNNNTVNNITQNNTTNNNIQNNIIFELGNENFEQVLTDQQKLQILNQKYSSIEYFIKKYHCNRDYPQFQNVKITSLTKSHCDVYSKKDKKYITKDLKDVIEQLVDCRIGDLNIILDETPNVPENTNIAVRGLFEKMDTDEEYKKEKYKKVKMTMYSEFRNKQL
jgi:exonuclease VII small subunit